MNLDWSDVFRFAAVFGFPIVVIGSWAIYRWRLYKENKETSEILRKKS